MVDFFGLLQLISSEAIKVRLPHSVAHYNSCCTVMRYAKNCVHNNALFSRIFCACWLTPYHGPPLHNLGRQKLDSSKSMPSWKE